MMTDGPNQPDPQTPKEGGDKTRLSSNRRPGADADMVDRAEVLAERAMSAFAEKLELPSVRDEATRALGFLVSIDSWSLRFVVATLIAASLSGFTIALVGIEPVGTLPDWHMHGAMYIALTSFCMLYVKAHRRGRLFGSILLSVVCIGLFVFFAWILFDRVPVRTLVFVESDLPRAVRRPSMPVLAVPGWLLLVSAAGLCFHVLVSMRPKRVQGDAGD